MKIHGIAPDFLPKTNDIWARDFMPIQVNDNKFIEYRYDPDYLQAKKYRELKTYSDIVCDTMGLKTVKTDIILDGGNVIKSSNHVLLADKIVLENLIKYSKEQLIDELKDLFEVDNIVLIPWDKQEPYGHADGMLRFIDNSTVLLQDYFQDYSDKFRTALYGALDKAGLSFEELKFEGENIDERSWAYMNFLQTKDIILLPSFGIPEDDIAYQQLKNCYPDYAEGKIHQINMTEIANKDGALNCISWTIKV